MEPYSRFGLLRPLRLLRPFASSLDKPDSTEVTDQTNNTDLTDETTNREHLDAF